jgi:hypothetical protein
VFSRSFGQNIANKGTNTLFSNTSYKENLLQSTTNTSYTPIGRDRPRLLFHSSNIHSSNAYQQHHSSSSSSNLPDNYENRNYLNFLESSFNNAHHSMSSTSSMQMMNDIYDQPTLKKEIKQLTSEKEQLLQDIKKSLLFNYFFDSSELSPYHHPYHHHASSTASSSHHRNVEPESTISHSGAESSSTAFSGFSRDTSAFSTLASNNRGNSTSSSESNTGYRSTSTSPRTGDLSEESPRTSSDPNNSKNNKPTSTIEENNNSPIKQSLIYYRIASSNSLKFLYLSLKLQSGKSIIKSKKNTVVSSKSGEYLSKVYNLRRRIIYQCSTDITDYEKSIKLLKELHFIIFEKIENYFQELKEIDYEIIKQFQLKSTNDRLIKKDVLLLSDKEKLLKTKEKLKIIIKSIINEIKMIYLTTNQHPSTLLTTKKQLSSSSASSSSSSLSPLKSAASAAALQKNNEEEVIVKKSLENTSETLSEFSNEVSQKMNDLYELTLKSLERKKALFASLNTSPVSSPGQNPGSKKIVSASSPGTKNRKTADILSPSQEKKGVTIVPFSVCLLTLLLFIFVVELPPVFDEALLERYSLSLESSDGHIHSLDNIRQVNNEIRERIIQESEKNHAKYDYLLKLQQNQFQSRFQLLKK